MNLPRHDWFQTETLITITILKRGVALDTCKVSFSSIDNQRITVNAGDEIIFTGRLKDTVKTGDVTLTVTPSKVEVRLPKEKGGRWNELLEKEEKKVEGDGKNMKKNWDKIEKEVAKEEEEEELTGDAAVNRMFKKIYADASDDVKKAMMKSYQESNGTVLSTNWAEIGSKKTEIKPPECMEFKKYEQ